MKNLIKAFTLLMLVFIAGQGFSNTTAKEDTVVIKTKIYCDHCTQCESCGGKLEGILDVKGVKDMKLDAENMTITVMYNAKKTSPEKIRQAISKLGFDADDVPADPEAVKELDGCCKKP